METPSITRIKELKTQIRTKIETRDKSLNVGNTYGGENEYQFLGLIGGLSALLTDIGTLVKAPNKFVKLSTLGERHSIISWLPDINDNFTNPANYISDFENLKRTIRFYNLRYTVDRQIEFEQEIESVLKLKIRVEENLQDIESLKSTIDGNNKSITEQHSTYKEQLDALEKEISILIQKKESLISENTRLEGLNSELESIRDEARYSLSEIEKSLNEVKSDEKLIDSFASRVQERENKLSELEARTTENNIKLEDYEKERVSILENANQLINSAKEALKYKTAEGISASFQQQYNSANNRLIYGGWIAGALLCLGTAIALGIWIVNSSTSDIWLVVGRISLLPFPIIGAIFCANQYTKQKNIIEDYAYKMVLSKAIVGFSEQLKKNGSENNEEYVHYIKTALGEIHKDPLRQRRLKNTKSNDDLSSLDLKSFIEIAEKIAKFSKSGQG